MSTETLHIDQSILDRIKSAFEISTDTELAYFLGVKQSTIATWKRRSSFNLELIISKCNDLNLNWLLLGEGPMYKKDLYTSHVEEDQQAYIKKVKDFEPIPYWEGQHESESVDLTVTSFLKSRVAFSRSWIKYELHMNWRDLYCVRMDGPSMEPMYKNGDELIININRTEPRDGPAYLVMVKERPHIKLITLNDGSNLYLRTANPRFEPIRIKQSTESFKIIGEVVCRVSISDRI